MLQERATMFARARSFFSERGVLEVDCPILASSASVDAHIDLIETTEGRFLHTSPEYAMKRLLSEGCGDIYQLGHVFRKGEYGVKHSPEFTMAEWYRLGMPFEQMIEETADFIRLFLGELPLESITYREAFQKYLRIDVDEISEEALYEKLVEREIIPIRSDIPELRKEELLNQLLAIVIEPQLGNGCLTVLWGYPKDQAALARTVQYQGKEVAERFEIYHEGIELCNGYHELTDAKEQKRRFLASNEHRLLLKKEALPIDDYFLAALDQGLPDCCGVAVGVDRLMMLRLKAKTLGEILPFSWHII
jgi:lysyl-tRNA synthetase class 2